MKRAGIVSESLGKDLTAAIKRAEYLNDQWDRIRRGDEPTAPAPAPGTFDALVAKVEASAEYRDKRPRTREELDYAVKIIRPVFGPSQLEAITADHCRRFYDGLRNEGSIHKAAKVYKWFRYLLGFAVRYDLATSNPSHAVRIKKPASRTQTWTPDQVMAYIDRAWQEGERGFACIVAVIYDTSLRPSDARLIEDDEISLDAELEGEHHLARRQVKTGRPVKVPLWPETAALISVYRETLAFAPMAGTPLFRSRKGRPFSKDHLTRVARQLRDELGLDETLQLRDLRRTASKERADSDATAVELAAGAGWSIARGQNILDTYNPTTYANAKSAQVKRGRRLRKMDKLGPTGGIG